MDHPQQRAAIRRLAARRRGAALIPGSARRRCVLDDSDVRFYRRFMRSLTRQVRHLRHTVDAMRATACRACRRAIALTYAALCMAGQQRHIRAATKRLSDELAAPDPARRRAYQPQSRRADRAAGRSAAAAQGVHRAQHRAAAGAAQRHRPHDADAALLPAWRRQLRAVQRHGARRRPICSTTILAYDDARGTPLANAPHSGYQRLESRRHAHHHGYRPAAAAGGEPGGACRLPRLRALRQAAPHRGQLRPAGDQPRELAAGGARDRRAFHRDLQRCVVLPFHRIRAAQAHAARHARWSAARARSRSTREEQPRRRCAARLARRLCRPLQRRPPPRADALARRTQARRRGPVHAGEGRGAARRAATSSRCASICIPRSRPTGWRTGTAPCC